MTVNYTKDSKIKKCKVLRFCNIYKKEPQNNVLFNSHSKTQNQFTFLPNMIQISSNLFKVKLISNKTSRVT